MRSPSGLKTTPTSRVEVEKKAAAVRTALGFTTVMPGLDLFEALPDYCIVHNGQKFRLDPDVDDLPGGIEGWTEYICRNNTITICLDTKVYKFLELEKIYSVNDPRRLVEINRARFTLGHELGHALLHVGELVSMGRIPHHQQVAAHLARRAPHEFHEDTEWQANSFASALLMPAGLLAAIERDIGRLEPDEVQRRFGVSATAARTRITNYQKLPRYMRQPAPTTEATDSH
jgi:hypothetical protein